MNKIIKRLEIIKSAIELEDEEIIHQQLVHLKRESDDPAIASITHAIEARRFSDAMREIADWLQGQRALSTWQDPAIAASKLELKTLEAQLRELIDTRNSRIQILDEFNDLYHLRLGPLMSRILELRQQLAASAQRKQEAERKRREKDYLSCQQYLSLAIDRLAQLKQSWMAMSPTSRDAVEIRQRIQQQTELIASLLAEICDLEDDFSRQTTVRPARRRKKRRMNTRSIRSNSRKLSTVTRAISVCQKRIVMNLSACGVRPAGCVTRMWWRMS